MTWHIMDESRSPGLKQRAESVVENEADAIVTSLCSRKGLFWALLSFTQATFISDHIVFEHGLVYNAGRAYAANNDLCKVCNRRRKQ